MKKKLLSLALALVMLASLTIPAAAQAADDRLGAVTARVKTTLGLNTDAYTEFYGDLDENILAPSWYLEWNGDNGSLSVNAAEDGKILSYYRYETAGEPNSGAFAPSFPAGDRETARQAAKSFMDKVLTKGETVTLEDSGSDRLNMTTYRFRGEILLNGLSAGLTYSIGVRCEDNVVTSFYRDDLTGKIMGGIPSAQARTTQAQARAVLRDTLALRLEYVLAEDGENRAVLRYLPEYGDEYYVDAATGKLVNLTELARDIARGDAGGSANTTSAAADTAEAEEAPAGSLTGAEQAGAEKLEGVLDREALDKKVRAISALGLDDYTLSTVNYSVARVSDGSGSGEPAVTAALRYGCQVNGSSWRRTVTVDAKTGELLSVYSSAWLPEEGAERGVDMEEAQKKAAAFLNSQCGGQFAKTALYDSADALESERTVSHSFTFAQKANGYFFPENSLRVGVDATDGSISAYSKSFLDDVAFDSVSGILTAGQALDAWLGTYDAELAYIQVPTAIDFSQPEYRPLLEYGISYLYKLVLGYSLEREDYLQGIDARTGEPVKPDWAEESEGIVYSDLSGHWAKAEIEALAKYGVGYGGGAFRPNSALTQLDLIALLASTEGYLYDGESEDASDELYDFAYKLGLLRPEDRRDGAVLTRAAAVRFILDAMGYGSVAQLEGIFRTKFSDDRSIPAAYYGYVALAQGLGMVDGGANGQFRPNASATRAQAAVMLYNLMAR